MARLELQTVCMMSIPCGGGDSCAGSLLLGMEQWRRERLSGRSRQILVCTLPVNCSCPEEKWTLANTAFILDRGLPEGASKKSRSYLLLQRLPATQRGEEEEEENLEEEEDDGREGEEDADENPQMETDSQISARTQQSQLSYKPMTPQAPPLPEGLGLTRESAMINGGRDPQPDAVEPPLVSHRPTSGQQQQEGSRPTSASTKPRPPSGARPGSTTSQGRRPPSEMSTHSRGKESETGPASVGEDADPAAAEGVVTAEGDPQGEGGEEAPRGNEPEIEQLNRQGEMQRGDDRVLDDKENQEEEKEKDETEEAEKAQSPPPATAPPADAGAGVQSRGHTPHPGEMPPRGPSAGSRHSAGQRRASTEDERAQESKAEAAEDVQATPPVKEDRAGRGGQMEAEPEKAGEPTTTTTAAAAAEEQQQQRPSNFTERAEDSLHVEADMKATVDGEGEDQQDSGAAGRRPPTQPGSKPASRQTNLGLGSRPPTQPGSKPPSRQTNLGLGSRPPTQGSRTGSRPPTQPRGLRKN